MHAKQLLPFGKVLAVGAHCDDIEIGCGGTLLRLAESGIPTYGLIVTDTHYQRDNVVVRNGATSRKEAEMAAKVIGYQPFFGNQRNNGIVVDENLVYLIRGLVEKHEIDTVFTHWDGDSHLDHARVAQATIMATRDTRNLYMYRCNRFKVTAHFPANQSFDITDTWQTKLSALKCYESELRRLGNHFLEYVENWNRCEGIATGTQFAESFLCVKSLM
jgi:LmbE family N-acetylglucosaminyl deacetylase